MKDKENKKKISFENMVLIVEVIVFFGFVIYGIVRGFK